MLLEEGAKSLIHFRSAAAWRQHYRTGVKAVSCKCLLLFGRAVCRPRHRGKMKCILLSLQPTVAMRHTAWTERFTQSPDFEV